MLSSGKLAAARAGSHPRRRQSEIAIESDDRNGLMVRRPVSAPAGGINRADRFSPRQRRLRETRPNPGDDRGPARHLCLNSTTRPLPLTNGAQYPNRGVTHIAGQLTETAAPASINNPRESAVLSTSESGQLVRASPAGSRVTSSEPRPSCRM